MTAKPLRLAFIGAGGITSAHSPSFKNHPGLLKLVVVADASAGAARKLAEPFGAAAYDDAERMLGERAGELDGVIITTPHFLHHPQAAAALRRGLPVLVEKPATCTVAELDALMALEKQHGAFVQAGQMQRFGGSERWIKRWLHSEEFGEARLFNVDIYQNIEGYVSNKPEAWILDKAKAGGGVVISVAVHILDLLRFWLEDDFVEVYARGRFDPPFKNGAESMAAVTLSTRKGVVGTLNASYTAARCPYSQRTLLFGTHGTLAQHMDKLGGGYAGSYYLSTDGGQPSPEWKMMYSGWQPVDERFKSEPLEEEWPGEGSFERQLLAFAEGIRRGRALENSLARNRNTIAVIEAIETSLAGGRPVSVA
ncbi:MAG: gfo/Idh/MocA family oxidoreductase [Puniceicoccaceae bacterium]|nr:MAG: gfo/Idh/MocA family oxidoreductase [Puniceicoccaceae bacterium]